MDLGALPLHMSLERLQLRTQHPIRVLQLLLLLLLGRACNPVAVQAPNVHEQLLPHVQLEAPFAAQTHIARFVRHR